MNPGAEVFNALDQEVGEESPPGVLSRVDAVVQSDGRFVDLARCAALAYVTRRLISAAASIHEEHAGRVVWLERLRQHLADNYGMTGRLREKLHALLQECVRNRRTDIPPALVKRLRNAAAEKG